jgi:hypothetical protein
VPIHRGPDLLPRAPAALAGAAFSACPGGGPPKRQKNNLRLGVDTGRLLRSHESAVAELERTIGKHTTTPTDSETDHTLNELLRCI